MTRRRLSADAASVPQARPATHPRPQATNIVERLAFHPYVWPATALVLSVLALGSVVNAFVLSQDNGCAFIDGQGYCRLATGQVAAEPFNRRIAVPTVVSWLPGAWSVVDRFRLVSVLGSVGVVVAVYVGTRQLLRRHRAPGLQTAPVAAAALIAMSPHTFRMALGWPVLLDQVAAAVGVLWCLLATARSPVLRAGAPAVALTLLLIREAWALPLLLAAGVLMLVLHERRQALLTVGVVLVGVPFVLTRPFAPSDYNSLRAVLGSGWRAVSRPVDEIWFLLFGLSLVTALVVLLVVTRHVLREPLHAVVLAVAVGHLLQAPISGTDVGRIAFAALPFTLMLATVAAAHLTRVGGATGFAVLSAGTLVLWHPFFLVLPARERAYSSFYYPRSLGDDLAALSALALCVSCVWLLARRAVRPPVL